MTSTTPKNNNTSDSKLDSEIDEGAPVGWKKYSEYSVEVDPDQDDKATEIKLCNFNRPHMRAFHLNWFSFFMAFCLWYTIVPLLSEIKKTLHLTKQQVWTSQIVGVAGTIFVRFLVGPLNDKFGARALMAIFLCLCAIPVACVGLINDLTGLCILRFFIGLVGGSFVMCQYWTSRMFAKEIVGTANAVAAGWGNLGGGVIQLVTGSLLYPLFKDIFFKGQANAEEMAWRTVCIVPAFFGVLSGIACYLYSDDAPKGNFHELKKHGAMPEVSAVASFRQGATNFNTWILFFHYAACFGVELTINNAAALYFHDEFGQSTESAALIASLFGFMNIFSRATGGWMSDQLNAGMGMKGRVMIQAIMLVTEGCLILIFAHTHSLGGSIAVMTILAFFVQAGCGTSYSIVPYVDPPATGSVSGVVGAGGNCGAVCFNIAFRQFGAYADAFAFMGFSVLGISLSTFVLVIKGHRGLIWGEDTIQLKKLAGTTLQVPDKDVSVDNDDEDA